VLYHYRQRAFFKGAGNIIFWREAEGAERLRAIPEGEEPVAPTTISSAGLKVADLSAVEAFKAVTANIAEAPVALDPAPNWCGNEVFLSNI